MMFSQGCKDDSVVIDPGGIDEKGLYFPALLEGIHGKRLHRNHLIGIRVKIKELYQFLDDGSTRAFLVLKDGKNCFRTLCWQRTFCNWLISTKNHCGIGPQQGKNAYLIFGWSSTRRRTFKHR